MCLGGNWDGKCVDGKEEQKIETYIIHLLLASRVKLKTAINKISALIQLALRGS